MKFMSMDYKKIRLYAIIITLYTIITLLVTYPLVVNLKNNLFIGDPYLNAWILAWDVHSILTSPMHLFDANAFYPFTHNSLAFSEHMIANIFISLPIIAATNNPILAYNVIFILSYILSGFGMFLLVDYYLNDKYSAFLAGVIFAFCTYRFAHFVHLQLLTAQWMPFSLLYFDKFLNKNTYKNLFLFFIFFVLQVLSCWYYAFSIVIALGLYFIYLSISDLSIRHNIFHSSDFKLKSVLFVILCIITILPFTLPYIHVQHEYGFTRSIDDVEFYSADVADYFLTPPSNILYGELSQPYQEERNWGEHSLFPGLLVIFLSIIGIFSISRIKSSDSLNININFNGKATQNYYILLAFFAFILTLGSTLHFFGNSINLHLPYYYLYKYLPGFDSMRVPSRFDIIVMLSLSVLAGYGLSKLLASKKENSKTVITSLFVMMVILESYVPVDVAITPADDQIPEMYKWLSNESDDFAIVELPTGNVVGNTLHYDTKYMYYSTYHWKKLVNGYSGFFPPKYMELLKELQTFPSNESIQILHSLKIRYIIIHSGDLNQDKWNAMNSKITNKYKNLKLEKVFGQDYVYIIDFEKGVDSPINVDIVSTSVPKLVQKGGIYQGSVTFYNYDTVDYITEPLEKVRVAINYSSNKNIGSLDESTTMLPLKITSQSATYIPFNINSPKSTGEYDVLITVSDDTRNITKSFVKSINVVDDLEDSVSSSSVHAEYLDYNIPSTVPAGSNFRVSVNALNDGAVLWRAKVSPVEITKGQVRLGSKWLQDETEGRTFERGLLPHDVSPGQNVTVEMKIDAPKLPGEYVLELDLVNEWTTWFEQQGVKIIKQKITVT